MIHLVRPTAKKEKIYTNNVNTHKTTYLNKHKINKQPLKFTSAVCNCRGFCWGKQCFYSNHLSKNTAEVYFLAKYIFSLFLNKIIIYKEEISLASVREGSVCATRSQVNIYVWQFIHPLSLHSGGSGTSFAFRSHIIRSAKFCNVTFLNNFYFVSVFYHLFICCRQRKIRLVILSKSCLYKFFF